MRFHTLLTAVVTFGYFCQPAFAQTTSPSTASPTNTTFAQTTSPNTASPTNTASPASPASSNTAVPLPPPSSAPGTPTVPETQPSPPPYPAAPDSLVMPPGPPAPMEPQPPDTVPSAPVEPPPIQPTVYYDGRVLPPDMRRPPRYRYVEGTPLPEGYHIETRANRGLVIGGVATFGIPYLIGTFGTLSVLGDGNSGWLAIPIAGPWITLANRRTNCGEIGEPSPGGFECFADEAGNGLLIASGVLQAVGTAMIALGLASTREYAVADHAKLHITPIASPKGDFGLVVGGTL
jgi:hypothetical protein